jgi:hypothetical protein
MGLDRGVELLVAQAGGPVDHLARQPDVVLDHAGHQVHRGHLSCGRQAEAAGRVEVHAARPVDPGAGGVLTPAAGRGAVLPRERPGERLVGAEAGLERDVDHLVVTRQEAVGRALEQEATAHPLRRLTARGGHDPGQVEARPLSS